MGELKVGSTYRFRSGEEMLTYLGFNWSGNGYWHQFALVGEQKVWAELTNNDLHLIVEAKESE